MRLHQAWLHHGQVCPTQWHGHGQCHESCATWSAAGSHFLIPSAPFRHSRVCRCWPLNMHVRLSTCSLRHLKCWWAERVLRLGSPNALSNHDELSDTTPTQPVSRRRCTAGLFTNAWSHWGPLQGQFHWPVSPYDNLFTGTHYFRPGQVSQCSSCCVYSCQTAATLPVSLLLSQPAMLQSGNSWDSSSLLRQTTAMAVGVLGIFSFRV